MKVPGVGRNLVPDTWTADGEGALPNLGSCPHDNLRWLVGCCRLANTKEELGGIATVIPPFAK